MATYSKEQIIDAIHKLAAELGRAPRLVDLQRACPGLLQRNVVNLFGTYARALEECGMESVRKRSTLIPFPTLFEDWAQAARRAGRCPSAGEYAVYGNYSVAPLIDRAKSWKLVPKMMDEYIHLRQEVRNVLEIRYQETIDPDKDRWELCSRVLARRDVVDRLSAPW